MGEAVVTVLVLVGVFVVVELGSVLFAVVTVPMVVGTVGFVVISTEDSVGWTVVLVFLLSVPLVTGLVAVVQLIVVLVGPTVVLAVPTVLVAGVELAIVVLVTLAALLVVVSVLLGSEAIVAVEEIKGFSSGTAVVAGFAVSGFVDLLSPCVVPAVQRINIPYIIKSFLPNQLEKTGLLNERTAKRHRASFIVFSTYFCHK